jgi:Trm5-related predicted tRNA methylase
MNEITKKAIKKGFIKAVRIVEQDAITHLKNVVLATDRTLVNAAVSIILNDALKCYQDNEAKNNNKTD